jgi:K+-sensing histidine kinase KdpD
VLLSGVVLLGTWNLSYWSDYAPGPRFLAVWVAGIGFLLAVLLVSSKSENASEPIDDTSPNSSTVESATDGGVRRVILTVAALGLMLIGLPMLGLRGASMLFMLFMLLVVLRRSWISSVTATAITVAIVHVVFVYWLKIDIPAGLFSAS